MGFVGSGLVSSAVLRAHRALAHAAAVVAAGTYDLLAQPAYGHRRRFLVQEPSTSWAKSCVIGVDLDEAPRHLVLRFDFLMSGEYAPISTRRIKNPDCCHPRTRMGIEDVKVAVGA